MATREESDASDSPKEEDPEPDPLDQPRDLDELLHWHRELALGPAIVSNVLEKRKNFWISFRAERDCLNDHMKWNKFLRYFGSHLLQQRDLDSGNWRSRLDGIRASCSAEDAIISSGMTLRSLAMCRVHKGLKYTTRVKYGVYHVNYRLQSSILELLPLPSIIIHDLIKLGESCIRHREACGLAHIGESYKYQIIKCTHETEEDELGRKEPCKNRECQLYELLKDQGGWKDRYSRRPYDHESLAQDISDKIGLPIGWMLLDQGVVKGLQTLTFSE